MSSSNPLHALAQAAGIQIQWHDVTGRTHAVTDDVLHAILEALHLPARTAGDLRDSLQRLHEQARACPPLLTATIGQPVILPGCLPAGVWQIELEHGGELSGTVVPDSHGRLVLPPIAHAGYHRLNLGEHSVTLAVAPERCVSLETVCYSDRPHAWGVSVQLYGVRSEQHGLGGVGDYSSLESLARAVARAGGDALAISPVHAMFSANPYHYSPYAPSSREWFNVSHVDPYQTFDAHAVRRAIWELGLEQIFSRLEESLLVDWPTVVRARMAVMRRLFDAFAHAAPLRQVEEFKAFRREGGQSLEQHAVFEALHARLMAEDLPDWQTWPAEYRRPDTSEVRMFAREHGYEIGFHIFLQWLATRGLQQAQATATSAGMNIGIITDVAVGTDPAGSQAWSRPDDLLTGLTPGAPPDAYNPLGQAWGLTAFSPQALRRNGYQAFIATLRAALRHAGGVRIDHALGLARMWLVPRGADPTQGAFVHYPFDDMARLIALESARHRAVILAENLGSVPPDFNARIHAAGMYGMSVLWFERRPGNDTEFLPTAEWDRQNVAMTSTHDLPTVAGWWNGRDLDWRARLQLLGGRGEDQARAQRARERTALWMAVRRPDDPPEPPQRAPLERIIDFVGRTPAPLVLMPLDDLCGVIEQANLPGTVNAHPNWRRRMPETVEQLFYGGAGYNRVQQLARARRRSVMSEVAADAAPPGTPPPHPTAP